ncbi:hypothetical protein NL676_029936 [Syzygium grande]|nr:hypothetical protein NL676_029936 [Syzygium grande]
MPLLVPVHRAMHHSWPSITPMHCSWPSVAPVYRRRASLSAEHRGRELCPCIVYGLASCSCIAPHGLWPHRTRIAYGRTSCSADRSWPCSRSHHAKASFMAEHHGCESCPCIVHRHASCMYIVPHDGGAVHHAHASLMAEHASVSLMAVFALCASRPRSLMPVHRARASCL